MPISIQQIAELLSGIYINASSSRGDTVYYLQMRHWDKERKWSRNIEPELREEKKLSKYYLRAGDILLATKGVDHFAALYDGLYKPAIASSVFTVLRVKDPTVVLPGFLQWFLNHPVTNKKLSFAARGSSMPLITRDVIEKLMMPVPSLEKQQLIITTHGLQESVNQLRLRLNQLNDILFQHSLLTTANK